MAFDVSADAYDRFMGRFSHPLAPLFAGFAGIEPPMRVLDVGCGAGALATELAGTLGSDRVAGADPSARFVEAARARLPGVDVRHAVAEALPWAEDEFDAALAQLVVSFMSDPSAGAAEMRRVVRPGGIVALSMWDLDGGMEMLAAIARAGRAVDPDAPRGRRGMVHTREGELRALLEGVGLQDVETGQLEVEARYEHFDELWEPLLEGVGPASTHVLSLEEEQREAMRGELHRQVGEPEGPFVLRARAWAARGVV